LKNYPAVALLDQIAEMHLYNIINHDAIVFIARTFGGFNQPIFEIASKTAIYSF
jgi:hypothetical protein